eukprot:734771-Pleurochrysis_carterae.AAC.1
MSRTCEAGTLGVTRLSVGFEVPKYLVACRPHGSTALNASLEEKVRQERHTKTALEKKPAWKAQSVQQ